jgi:hypothetical protein
MTQQDLVEFATGLPDVVAVTAGEENGAPEVAWGDVFFFYEPEGPTDRRMPFATIVTKDYDGFDGSSDLNRPGVFRLNISVGRTSFEELLGYPPAAHAEQGAAFDHTALDRLLPHPVYAPQGWVSILDPGDATGTQARALLVRARARAAARHRPRG